MVCIFAREITGNLASLVKKVDKAVGENKDKKMAAFVVLLSEDPDTAETKLKEFAKKHKIKNVPLTIYEGIAGPEVYKVSKDADVTALLWLGQTIKANHAFAKGKLKKAGVKAIMKDTSKILE